MHSHPLTSPRPGRPPVTPLPQISWDDGFNQVAAFELLDALRPLAVSRSSPKATVDATIKGLQAQVEISG